MFTAHFLQWLQEAENVIFLFINGIHAPFFDFFMDLCSDKWIWLPLYSALLWLFFIKQGLRLTLVTIVCITLIIFISDQTAVHVVRSIFPRMRPSNPDNPIEPMVHLVNGYRSGRFGFPSAHAANVFGLTTFCAWMFRYQLLTFVMVGWATLVCYSRIYLGVHYLGDMIGGVVIGFSAATIVYFAQRKAFPATTSPRINVAQALVPSAGLGLSLLITLVYSTIALSLN